ncbi:MAG: hypothetical protein R3F11_03605 [Verrucomicrobiales bacterium]
MLAGIARPQDTPAPPATLDWNLWMAGAPERPYHPAYHPFKWRGWWDFGCGALGDMGCHHLDPIFRALKLASPISVEAECEGIMPETGPAKSTIVYEFAAGGDMPALTLTWYDGGRELTPPAGARGGPQDGRPLRRHALGRQPGQDHDRRLGDVPRLIPEKAMQAYQRRKNRCPLARYHEEFVIAAKGGDRAGADFAYGGPLTESALLGNVALRAGEKFTWDAALMKTSSEKANAFLGA